ncbi:hypothetical protein CERZMDRAFT_99938 [Cercospora zeae-maydis SCOH1-5]|uniref:Uncharacterized protein n=1 Tax=Cercospora zeae-maydis SCOH1-5 TaxID=717836 RepID=A0A6A6F907_9PEZI|nr:hypothetical protein CERZMDRAFT_99938 [Cercospora zeae-maydis SCOH1-5]
MQHWDSLDYLNDPRTTAVEQLTELQKEISSLLAGIQDESAAPSQIQDRLTALLDKSKALDQSLKSFVAGPAREDVIKGSASLSQLRYRLFPVPPTMFRLVPATHTPKGVATSIRFHTSENFVDTRPRVLNLLRTSIIVQLTDKVHRIPQLLNAGCQNLLISENPVVKSMQIWKSCSKARHQTIPADIYFPRLFTTKGKLSPGPPSTLTTSSCWASPLLQTVLHDEDGHYLHLWSSERFSRLDSKRDGYIPERDGTIADDDGSRSATSTMLPTK